MFQDAFTALSNFSQTAGLTKVHHSSFIYLQRMSMHYLSLQVSAFAVQ